MDENPGGIQMKTAVLRLASVLPFTLICSNGVGDEDPCVWTSVAELDASTAKRYEALMPNLSHVKECCMYGGLKSFTGIGKPRYGAGFASFDLGELDSDSTEAGTFTDTIGVAEHKEGQSLDELVRDYIVVSTSVEPSGDLHDKSEHVIRTKHCLESCQCLHEVLGTLGLWELLTDPVIRKLRKSTRTDVPASCAQLGSVRFDGEGNVRVVLRMGTERWALRFTESGDGRRKLFYISSIIH